MKLPSLNRPFEVVFDRRLTRRGRWILLSALVGAASGVFAILFDLVTAYGRRMDQLRRRADDAPHSRDDVF